MPTQQMPNHFESIVVFMLFSSSMHHDNPISLVGSCRTFNPTIIHGLAICNAKLNMATILVLQNLDIIS